jgi:hypothetical protein
MPIRFAIASGSFYDPAIWDSGLGVPTASDDVYANRRRIVIDSSVTVASFRNSSTGSIIDGGTFIVSGSSPITLIGNIAGGNSATNSSVHWTVQVTGSGTNATIIGSITGSSNSAASNYALYCYLQTTCSISGAITQQIPGVRVDNVRCVGTDGLMNITGSITNPSTAGQLIGGTVTFGTTSQLNISGTIFHQNNFGSANTINGSGDLNFIGTVTASNAFNSFPFQITNAGIPKTYNFIGTFFFPQDCRAIYCQNASAVLNIYPTIVRTIAGTSFSIDEAGTWNFYGDFNQGIYTGNVIRVGSRTNLRVNVVGNIRGGVVANAKGFMMDQNCVNTTCSIVGNVYGGSGGGITYPNQANGIYVSSGTNSLLTGEIVAIQEGFDVPVLCFTTGTKVYIKKAVCNTGSLAWPCTGYVGFINNSPEFVIGKQNGTSVTLADPTLQDPPAPTNVRNGVSYSFGTFTGTLVVPTSSAVSYGVAVDNTTGSAILSANDFFNAVSGSSDPVAVRLRNVSTVQTTGDQLQAVFP